MSDRYASRPDTPAPASAPLGDEVIGGLVRDLAADWTMPPQRLGERTWRVRVEERESAHGGSGWRRRVTLSATLAVAATVVLALSAIWLNGPGRLPTTGNDSSSAPSATTSPDGSPARPSSPSPSAAIPSPAPTLAVYGDPLPVSSIVLSGEEHRMLDLTTGGMGPALERSAETDGQFIRRADGGYTCVCFTYDRPFYVNPSAVSLDLVDYDSTGNVERSRALGAHDGAAAVGNGQLVGRTLGVRVSLSERPDRVYVGWVVRTLEGWRSGVDVVDLVAGRIVQEIALPDLALEDAGGSDGPLDTSVDPPLVAVAPDGGRLVISQLRGVFRPNAAGAIDLVSTESGPWGAPIEGGVVGALTAFATGEGTLGPTCAPWPAEVSFASADVLVATCGSAGVLRRVDPRDGRSLGDVPVDGLAGGFAVLASAPDGRRYVWLPLARTLVEVDAVGGRVLRSATIDGLTGAVQPSTGDPLAALADIGRRLGRWIAPPAVAKSILWPAIAISPDGSRLYLLGVSGDDASGGWTGSTGVHVVDTATLTEVATWAPTADWQSIAVGGDGSLVYLVSAPDRAVDASGAVVDDPGRLASLTVVDAPTGEVRVIAGQLDGPFLLLDPRLVP